MSEEDRYITRSACRICFQPLPAPFLSLGPQPLANNLYSTASASLSAPRFPLNLVRCPNCTLTQLSVVVDPHLLFDTYLYTPDQSRSFQHHFAAMAADLTRDLSLIPGDLVCDIGSNSGLALSYFQSLGMRVVGVDPAENLVRQANERGIPTICAYWGLRTAEIVRSTYHQQAKLITATNVFAHVNNLHLFLDAVDTLLAPGGTLVIEVPSLPVMLRDGTFDLCLPPGEEILTAEGPKNIEEIREGDLVLTHQGRYRKVTKAFVRQYSGDLISVDGFGHRRLLRVTPEHPVYVKRFQQMRGGRGHQVEEYQEQFVSAGELIHRSARGDILLRPNLPVTVGPDPVFERKIDVLIRVTPKVKQKVWIEEGVTHSRIRSIEREHYEGLVYNLEVEEDNSYTTTVASVHNCYHEHLSFIDIYPLFYLFKSHDLSLYRFDSIPIHGGSFRLFIKRLGDPRRVEVTYLPPLPLSLFTAFSARASSTRDTLVSLIRGLRQQGKRVVGYGAPAKATVLISYAGLGSEDISYVVDDSLLKQNKFIPGTDIPIFPAEALDAEPADVAVIWPWNLRDELVKKLQGKVKQALIPMPDAELVDL